jgi:predicted membrane protein
MDFGAVNWIAIVVAAVASMALGAAWYMVLSKQWMAALGKTRDQVAMGSSATPFIIAFLMELVMAYSLALFVPRIMGSTTVTNGLIVAFHLWLGFVITSMIINHRYQGNKWSLTLIDGGYLLGVLLVQGVVIGLFG